MNMNYLCFQYWPRSSLLKSFKDLCPTLYSVNSLLISHFTGDSFSSLIRVLFSEPLSPNQILKKWSIVENHTGDLCQTKLLVCPIGKLAFKQRVIERGEPLQICTQATYQVSERRTAKLSNLLALLSLFT